jgi:hypothetical protein
VTSTKRPLHQHYWVRIATSVAQKKRAVSTLRIWVFIVTPGCPDICRDVTSVIEEDLARLAFAPVGKTGGFVGAAGTCLLATSRIQFTQLSATRDGLGLDGFGLSLSARNYQKRAER